MTENHWLPPIMVTGRLGNYIKSSMARNGPRHLRHAERAEGRVAAKPVRNLARGIAVRGLRGRFCFQIELRRMEDDLIFA